MISIQKFESWAIKPFFAIFNFISEHITYTFAIAFTTSLGGFVIAAYIALFLMATVRFDLSNNGSDFAILFTALTLFVYAPLYYIHFGLLYKVGIPCFTRRLSFINKYIHKNTLHQTMSDGEAIQLLEALEHLPKDNMTAALIYPSIVMVGVCIYEAIKGNVTNVIFLFLGISSAIFIYVFLTYIVAELLSGRMRRKVKWLLVKRGISFNERYILSIRGKFIFINIMVLVAMLELGLMIYYNNYEIFSTIPILFIVITGFIVFIILFFYLLSIEESLSEIESAAVDLARGGSGSLFLPYLDKELINTSKGFIAAAYEVNDIRRNLEQKVEQRTRELNQALMTLKEKNDLIDKELKIAANIQQGILPQTPILHNAIRILAYNRASSDIGGDLFDIIRMPNDCLGILIADVSGHGIPAALVSTMVKISFQEACRKYMLPRRIFADVNNQLVSIIRTQEYATAFFMVIFPTYDVMYANGSHRRAIVCKRNTGTLQYWDTGGIFLGALPNEEVGGLFEDNFGILEPGDRVFLYTDGLPESRNWNNEDFSDERVEKLLLETLDMPIDDAKHYIIAQWEKFLGGTPPRDDMTFVLLELDPIMYNALQHRENGKQLFAEKKYELAIDELKRSVIMNPDDVEALNLLARSYIYTRQFNYALVHLKEYVAKKPDDNQAQYFLAIAHYKLHNYDEAYRAAAHSLSLQPSYIPALSIMAAICAALHKTSEAIEYCNKILAADPGNVKAQKLLQKLSH
ncbi:MAG: SpoIIE family protein phosphatase [Spirochaetes bacterium]|nr:SpoIIE family protein phosphatase [Spirochaetota bacterium]